MLPTPLRIAYCLSSLQPGGLQQRCVQLANAAAARGHHVWLVAAQDGALRTTLDPAVAPVVLDVPPPFRGRGPARRAATLLRLRPDVVHGFSNVGLYHAVPLARLLGVRAVVATVGTPVLAPLLSRSEWLVTSQLLRCAHAVTGNGRDVVESLATILHLPRARLHRIPGWVDLASFPHGDAALRESARAELAGRGVPPDAWVIGTVGRLEPAKDPATWLAAAQAVPPTVAGRPVHWVWVGAGRLLAETQAQAAAAGLADRLHFLGERGDVPRWLQGFDLFVLSSCYEGLSNAVLEAAAAGLPVVTTAVAGSQELVLDGRTGWIVPIGDAAALAIAVSTALSRPAHLRRRGEAGRRYVARGYDRPQVVERYFELYQRLLRG